MYAEITISVGVMLRRMQNVEANFDRDPRHGSERSIQPASHRVDIRRGAAIRRGSGDGGGAVGGEARTSGVVAFGMGGDEMAFPTANFRPAFDLARAAGLRIVCHAGEIGGPQ